MCPRRAAGRLAERRRVARARDEQGRNRRAARRPAHGGIGATRRVAGADRCADASRTMERRRHDAARRGAGGEAGRFRDEDSDDRDGRLARGTRFARRRGSDASEGGTIGEARRVRRSCVAGLRVYRRCVVRRDGDWPGLEADAGAIEARVPIRTEGAWRAAATGEAKVEIQRSSLLGAMWWAVRQRVRGDILL